MGDVWIYINQENSMCIAHEYFNNSKTMPLKCSNIIIIPFTQVNDHLSHLMFSNIILLLIEKMFFMKGI